MILYDEEESIVNKDSLIEVSKILTRMIKKLDSDIKLISDNIPELKELQVITMIKNKKKNEPNNIIFDLLFKLKELEDIQHDDRYSSILDEKKLDMIKNSLGNDVYSGKKKQFK